eukprot:SAG31_NODE_17722_length_660_cov_0.784314_2_plen_83_part_00
MEVTTFADQALLTLKSEFASFAAGSLLAVPVTKLVAGDFEDALVPLFEPTSTASLAGAVMVQYSTVLHCVTLTKCCIDDHCH